MEKANNILLKILGLVLITAAVMKGWQLLTEPVAGRDIWTNRAFMIFTVEFELALGIWLLSGIFKKLAWLAATACFTLFTILTLYKGITGADSCGCFGAVQVNPWLTLFAVDLPTLIALLVFQLMSLRSQRGNLPVMSFPRKRESRIREFLAPLPSLRRLCLTMAFGLIITGISLPILALNKPPKETTDYMVLEPETWIGKELPILDYIDIGDQLRKDTWLIIFYHHDCPDCKNVIAQLENYDFRKIKYKIAIIEVPPYGNSIETSHLYGRLSDDREWFISTPVIAVIKDGLIEQILDEKFFDIKEILASLPIERR